MVQNSHPLSIRYSWRSERVLREKEELVLAFHDSEKKLRDAKENLDLLRTEKKILVEEKINLQESNDR